MNYVLPAALLQIFRYSSSSSDRILFGLFESYKAEDAIGQFLADSACVTLLVNHYILMTVEIE
jgi:hypothetical protein